MTTITEAQNELEDILVNLADRIPEDMSDWDMEDWTIYALNYFRANIEDAVELEPEGYEVCPVCVQEIKLDGVEAASFADHGKCHSCHKAWQMGEPKSVEQLWAELGDIPVNDDGEIGLGFVDFPPGTDREEIWHWFEETFDVAVHDLMYPNEKPENSAPIFGPDSTDSKNQNETGE